MVGADHFSPCYNACMQSDLVFLKLGGSLITDKGRAHTPRSDVIRRLAHEIALARAAAPLRILIGHGSGSFGHMEARKYGTVGGVKTAEDWAGFAAVWAAADSLNRLMMDALAAAGVPAIRIAPSSNAILDNGQILEISGEPVRRALDSGLVPVVYGDAVFDRTRGGGIASTEMVFSALANTLHPGRILLAGIETGVYADYPARTSLLPRIRIAEWESLRRTLEGSEHPDVTGGMLSKVHSMLTLVGGQADLKALVFSGVVEGNVRRALAGEEAGGTWLEK
jgi:isopentenyl phosphate kinase